VLSPSRSFDLLGVKSRISEFRDFSILLPALLLEYTSAAVFFPKWGVIGSTVMSIPPLFLPPGPTLEGESVTINLMPSGPCNPSRAGGACVCKSRLALEIRARDNSRVSYRSSHMQCAELTFLVFFSSCHPPPLPSQGAHTPRTP